jgi:hypothetical protein
MSLSSPLKYIVSMWRAFKISPPIEKKSDIQGNDHDEVDYRGIVARYARGNVLLQLGRFSTEGDIKARKNAIRSFELDVDDTDQ